MRNPNSTATLKLCTPGSENKQGAVRTCPMGGKNYIMQCDIHITQCIIYITQCVIHITHCVMKF